MSSFSALLSESSTDDASPKPLLPKAGIFDLWQRARSVESFLNTLDIPSSSLVFITHLKFAIFIALTLFPLEAIIYRTRKVRSTREIAATLYWELHQRAETLCEEHQPTALPKLMAII